MNHECKTEEKCSREGVDDKRAWARRAVPVERRGVGFVRRRAQAGDKESKRESWVFQVVGNDSAADHAGGMGNSAIRAFRRS